MAFRLVVHEELRSTQDLVRNLALAGEPEGLAAVALRQTAGRGRMGREWVSPPEKNLALSLLLRPDIPPQQGPLTGLAASYAAAEALARLGGINAELKWPNDVIVNGRKIAGILLEARITDERLDFVVIGLGLNLNSELLDFPSELRDKATSAFELTGRRWTSAEAAHVFLEHLEVLYERIRTEGCEFIPSLWKTRWAHRGTRIRRGNVVGIAEDVAQDGCLILRTHSGDAVFVHSGEAEQVLPDSR
jgi:BirA family transcriptional regulator, biotin operon repressor / biotin---[acetyl-CoA-carboxylase] ligase